MRVWLIDAPAGFAAEVAAQPGITRAGPRATDLDLIQAFFTRRAQLDRALKRLRGALAPRGILWVCYPKGQALGTDLNRDRCREALGDAGMEAVALVAIDEVWSALRAKVR
jgi:hypothetical protein